MSNRSRNVFDEEVDQQVKIVQFELGMLPYRMKRGDRLIHSYGAVPMILPGVMDAAGIFYCIVNREGAPIIQSAEALVAVAAPAVGSSILLYSDGLVWKLVTAAAITTP